MLRVVALVVAISAFVSSNAASATCRSGPVDAGNSGAKLVGQVSGRGAPVLMIPSLGRGPEDFAALAADIARSGHAAVTFDPRWFGRSTGPETATLADLGDDAAAVLVAACGPSARATVIGHAFGNRVARALAARHPTRVASVVLLAAGGQVPIAPEVARAIGIAASQGLRPDAERLAALRLAFFVRADQAPAWLIGWSPRAAELQDRALHATLADDWSSAGIAPLLIVQPTDDPVAPVANAAALAARAGARAAVIRLPKASHAILPEQPRAIAAVVARWLRGERRADRLQAAIDQRIMP